MNLGRFGRWFELTSEEKGWIGLIVAIFLIGLVARWIHLATADPFPDPAASEAVEE